ncbi:MAG: nuclear transport factor 2 family protein [Phycisphaeraceae bacterium]|nr:nuclear transport factor 2 family protein [Phycisphaerae bacterium]MBX3392119.1 nuclear transport factor 2 family protein [Phycisphaeraceae bacterium]
MPTVIRLCLFLVGAGAAVAALAGCASGPDSAVGASGPSRSVRAAEVGAMLDDWHRAASRADGSAYFDRMTGEAVFIGTDDTERWTRDEFMAFAAPYFGAGRGWTYVPVERHVRVSEAGDVAWADEKLDNEKYGRCRGTAVCVIESGRWKVAHYTLSFPVPNDLAERVVELIRAGEAGGQR